MDKRIKTLVADYEKAVNAIAAAFANKQNDAPDEPPVEIGTEAAWWIGDEAGGLLGIGDIFTYRFDDILTDLKEDAPVGEIGRWQEYCTRCSDCGFTSMNYRSWLHGAPRVPEECFKRIEDLRDEIQECADETNKAMKGGKA